MGPRQRDRLANIRQQNRERNAQRRQEAREAELERVRAEVGEIIDNHINSMGLVPNGNPHGQPINYLSDVRNCFGGFWSNNQKGCRQFLLKMVHPTFSPYDFRPIGDLPDGFMQMYFIIHGLLKHKNAGGNFLDGTWRQTVELVTETKNPLNDPELFTPMVHQRIIGEQKHVFVLKENISPEFYKVVVSAIASNIKNIPKFILKNLTRIVYLGQHHDSVTEVDVQRIEDPEIDCKYLEYISASLESLQTALKEPIICFSCVQGLPNPDQAAKHLDKFHGCINKLNVAESIDHRTQIMLSKEKEKNEQLVNQLAEKNRQLAEKDRLLNEALAEINRLRN